MKRNLLFIISAMIISAPLSAQWSDDPMQNLQISNLDGEQTIAKTALSPNGDYYIGYFSSEGGNYNVRLQRLDNQGNKLWGENGILISDHTSMSWLTDWDMTADHENHAILTWQDIRSGGNNNTVAYRIAPDGTFVWGDNGIMLSSSTAFDVSPKVTVTSVNNSVFAWQADNLIIMQKISPEGTKLWGEWGITLTSENTYSWPQLLPVGDDEIIMKFFDDSGPAWAPTRHILAQRFDDDGDPVWPSITVVSDEGNIQAWHQILSFENDGNDGFYIAWHDFTMSATQASSWIQHINSDGEAQFQTNGVLLSTRNDFNQFYPSIARPAMDENVYIYWREVNGNQNQWGIYGQKISPEGTRLWGDEGKIIFAVGSQAYFPLFAGPVDDDVVLVYDNGSEHIKASRINNQGSFVWEPSEVSLSNVTSSKSHFAYSGFDGNQWVFAWGDNRDGTADIYAQNLRKDGSIGSEEPGPVYFSLTLEISGEGSVEINGESYSEPITFEAGEEVTLEAIPADGWQFEGWSGDVESGETSVTITITTDLDITATFTEIPTYTLTLIAEPEIAGILFGAGEYMESEEVEITAEPSDFGIFLYWVDEDGNEITDNPVYSFLMPAHDLTLFAMFDILPFVPEVLLSDFILYPNPARHITEISTGVLIDAIYISDITGRLIWKTEGIGVTHYQIDVSVLNTGLYLVRVQSKNEYHTKRLQIVR
ncbi:MAG: T9SS C-terminal target domain-containing protein [Bacteroidetes bacterium]|nr:MAG: T9SS C-terminal target domain-containing protein [Bacteroidota bacterium]